MKSLLLKVLYMCVLCTKCSIEWVTWRIHSKVIQSDLMNTVYSMGRTLAVHLEALRIVQECQKRCNLCSKLYCAILLSVVILGRKEHRIVLVFEFLFIY